MHLRGVNLDHVVWYHFFLFCKSKHVLVDTNKEGHWRLQDVEESSWESGYVYVLPAEGKEQRRERLCGHGQHVCLLALENHLLFRQK